MQSTEKYQSFGKVTLSFSDILHCGMPPRGAPGEMVACCRMVFKVRCIEAVLAYVSSALQVVERTMRNVSFDNKCSTFVLCHVTSNVLINNEHFVIRQNKLARNHLTKLIPLSRVIFNVSCISCYAAVETLVFDGGLEDSVIHSVLFAVARFVVGETWTCHEVEKNMLSQRSTFSYQRWHLCSVKQRLWFLFSPFTCSEKC